MKYEENSSSDVKCKVTYYPTPVTKKPQGVEVAKISRGLTEVGEWSISQFVKFTQPPYSYVFSPATFEGNKRKNANWRSQQSFMLDFDSGFNLVEVFQRFQSHDLVPNFYYYTFSHSDDNPRFRVGLIVDQEINNPAVASIIRRGLMLAFPEADQSCKDASRMYYGGFQSVESNSSPIPLKSLYEFSSLHVVSNDSLRKRHLLDINAVPFINNKEGSGFYQYSDITNIKDPKRLEYLNNFQSSGATVSGLSGNVRLFDDFVMGEHLSYHQLRGLATNLQFIRGGQKLYFNTLDAVGDYQPCDYAVFHYVKHYQYYPTRLENFSPYKQDHKYSDLIEVLRKPKTIYQIKVLPKLSLAEAEKRLEDEFDKAINSKDSDIYIFKTVTGLGKTKLLESLEKTTVCFPTHDLKDEAHERFTSDHVCVPDKPHFQQKALNDRVRAYYNLGLNAEVRELIQRVARKEDGYGDIEEDVDAAHAYLQAEASLRNTDKTVLSTHLRGFFNRSSHSTLVFDEDPISSMFEMSSFKISELKNIEYDLKGETLRPLITELNDMKAGVVCDSPNQIIDEYQVKDVIKDSVSISGNVIKYFTSSSCMKDSDNPDKIIYLIRREVPRDKKVIIMSATANVDVYRALYGERVKVVDISNVEQKGKVVQYADRSYSRVSIQNLDEDELLQRCKAGNVITFQRYKDLIPEALAKMHFHNTEGFDTLKGEDVVVFGSPHLPELVYKFYAHELGWEIKPDDFQMKPRMIERNGYRFTFTTFGDERLQNLQMSFIEAELIQAVGRARTLRTDAEVTVFSNLPLPSSTEIRLEFQPEEG